MASETKAESLVKQAGADNAEGGRACWSQLPVKWGEGERAWDVAEGRAMGIDALEWLRQRWGMRKMTVYLNWQDGLYSRHHVLLANVFIQTLEHLLSACNCSGIGRYMEKWGPYLTSAAIVGEAWKQCFINMELARDSDT